MSLTHWFKPVDSTEVAAAASVAAVDRENIDLQKRGRKRKSHERHHFDEATKAEIGKFAAILGNKRAVDTFSKRLKFALSEATLRNFKREVLKQLKDGKTLDEVELPAKKKDVLFFHQRILTN